MVYEGVCVYVVWCVGVWYMSTPGMYMCVCGVSVQYMSVCVCVWCECMVYECVCVCVWCGVRVYGI